MFFADLNRLLLDNIRNRVTNGEISERSLARMVGVSQPHMHNLLCGKRDLNSTMADRILYYLRLSTLDLIEPQVLSQYAALETQDPQQQTFLPVLEGRLGPSWPWPGNVAEFHRFPVARQIITRMHQPVVVRVGDDHRMHPLFGDGDWALLDQSPAARTEVDTAGLYVIRRGRVGVLRHLRYVNRTLYMITQDSLDDPTSWEPVALDSVHITHVVRARATLISHEDGWTDPGTPT